MRRRLQASSSKAGGQHQGQALLDLMVKLVSVKGPPLVLQRVLGCLLAMLAVTPVGSRSAFAVLITSGKDTGPANPRGHES